MEYNVENWDEKSSIKLELGDTTPYFNQEQSLQKNSYLKENDIRKETISLEYDSKHLEQIIFAQTIL